MFLLADGALGTELLGRAVPPFSCLEALNLEQPEIVSSLHAEYRRAGADILTTNTFGANAYRLAMHGLVSRVHEINVAAVRLAREHADGALVAGSIGPSGEQRPRPEPASLRAAFRDQAAGLEEGGVDLFSCETFGDVEEARAAVLGIRDMSSRPILLQLTYTAAGYTPLGLTPCEVVAALADLPLAAIGINCAIGKGTAEHVLQKLRAVTAIPLIAQPNAGQPQVQDGVLRYPMPPEEFADLATRLSEVAVIVGGCCGTTPAHIAALRLRAPVSNQSEPGR